MSFISSVISSSRLTFDHIFYPMYPHDHGIHCPYCVKARVNNHSKRITLKVPGQISMCWDISELSTLYGARLIHSVEDSVKMINNSRDTCYIAILPKKPFPVNQFFETFIPLMSTKDTLMIIPYFHSGSYDLPYTDNVLEEGRKEWSKMVYAVNLSITDTETLMAPETKTLRDVFSTTVDTPKTIHEFLTLTRKTFPMWNVQLLGSKPIRTNDIFIGYNAC